MCSHVKSGQLPHLALSCPGHAITLNIRARAAIVLICLLFAGVTKAADDYWTGAADAYWSHSGNWLSGAVPGAGDVVRLDVNATANLNMLACAG